MLSLSQRQFGKCVDSFQTGGWTPWTMWHLTLVAVVTDPTVIRLIFGKRCMDGDCVCLFFSLLTLTIFLPLSHSFSHSALSYSASVSVSRDMTDRSYSLACQMKTDVSLTPSLPLSPPCLSLQSGSLHAGSGWSLSSLLIWTKWERLFPHFHNSCSIIMCCNFCTYSTL